jgi:glycosyltransferase involved in cell wall biosynthesis
VVIPCYNYGHFLPDAVASALDQTGVDVEVLIVDDASPDGSAAVARSLAAADPRVDVIAHEINRGHIATYNDGLAKASGDYVVLLSADDLLMPGALTRSVALMEAHPDVVLTYGYAADFRDEPPAPSSRREWWTSWSGDEWVALVCRRGRNLLVNPEVIMRAAVMRDLGGYDPVHPHAGDLEVWLRAARRGRVARVNGPTQAAYRIHGDNMHTSTYGDLLSDLRAVYAVFLDFLGSGGDGSGAAAERNRERAQRAMAHQAVSRAAVAEVQHAEGQDLIGFARECWPAVEDTLVARLLRRDQFAAKPARALLARFDRLRWALRWRRWRAIGT